MATTTYTRYFDPEDYSKNGYLNTISLKEDLTNLAPSQTKRLSKNVSENTINFFDNMMIDTSAISVVNLGHTITTWKVEDAAISIDFRNDDREPLFLLEYDQSRKQNNYQWSINSLDVVLGLVGGVAGVVWSTLAYSLGDYEQFKYENSLVGSIYPTSPLGSCD